MGAGPWPTVLVHPDGSATAADMRGVLWDLASQGYLAVAADYHRLHDSTCQRTLFPWCEEADMTTVLELLCAQPWVDGQRLAALGFSQGGIFSLLLAAQSHSLQNAMVAGVSSSYSRQLLVSPAIGHTTECFLLFVSSPLDKSIHDQPENTSHADSPQLCRLQPP